MNVVSIFENIEAPNVSIVKTENKMHNIFSDGCDGVIWEREPLLPFQTWIDELEVNQLPVARTIVQPSMLRDVVKACCDNSKMPITLDRTRLIDDIAALGNIFSDIMNAPLISLRLDCVTSNACKIFHVDASKTHLYLPWNWHTIWKFTQWCRPKANIYCSNWKSNDIERVTLGTAK